MYTNILEITSLRNPKGQFFMQLILRSKKFEIPTQLLNKYPFKIKFEIRSSNNL